MALAVGCFLRVLKRCGFSLGLSRKPIGDAQDAVAEILPPMIVSAYGDEVQALKEMSV